MISELLSASLIALRDCMGLQPNEKVFVVTDELSRTLACSLNQSAKK
ncbi:MAG: hypothetical protein KGZ58_04445 [Ignavibacteriales bacterium]|nr:hypothetical protein [Ignavibacteriales bacterium]